MKLLGKADTNWTQEGSSRPLTGFLSQNGSVDSVVYEYADGFRGGLRAWQAANKKPDVIVALRTERQGLFLRLGEGQRSQISRVFYSMARTISRASP